MLPGESGLAGGGCGVDEFADDGSASPRAGSCAGPCAVSCVEFCGPVLSSARGERSVPIGSDPLAWSLVGDRPVLLLLDLSNTRDRAGMGLDRGEAGNIASATPQTQVPSKNIGSCNFVLKL